MPNYCVVCGLSKSSDPTISLFRLPKEPGRRKLWLDNLGFHEQGVTTESRVCSRHFRDGNPQNAPSLDIGKEFSERPTNITPREKRHASREIAKVQLAKRSCTHTSPTSAVSPTSGLPSPLSLTSTPSQSPSSGCTHVLHLSALYQSVHQIHNQVLEQALTLRLLAGLYFQCHQGCVQKYRSQ